MYRNNQYIECECGFRNFSKPKYCASCNSELSKQSPRDLYDEKAQQKKRINNLQLGKHVFKKKPDTFIPYEFSPPKL
jgi:hypothetical protein